MVNTSDKEGRVDSALEQRTRDVFDQHTASLDARTLSRLNQARQVALNVVRKEKSAAMPRWLMPAGSVAALALVATMAFQFRTGINGNTTAQALSPLEDMEIIASNEDIDLLQDVDFYDSLDSVDASENGAG